MPRGSNISRRPSTNLGRKHGLTTSTQDTSSLRQRLLAIWRVLTAPEKRIGLTWISPYLRGLLTKHLNTAAAVSLYTSLENRPSTHGGWMPSSTLNLEIAATPFSLRQMARRLTRGSMTSLPLTRISSSGLGDQKRRLRMPPKPSSVSGGVSVSASSTK